LRWILFFVLRDISAICRFIVFIVAAENLKVGFSPIHVNSGRELEGWIFIYTCKMTVW